MRMIPYLKMTAVIFLCLGSSAFLRGQPEKQSGLIHLPEPELKGDVSVESALQSRRSIRQYKEASISIKMLGQILWAAQGITEKHPSPPGFWGGRDWPGGLRTAPSAGALYPLDITIAAGNVEDLPPGIYHYLPGKHALEQKADGDHRRALSRAALGQSPVREGAAVLIISGVYARCAAKYGDRAPRYTHIETGHVGQNIYLQAESLGLGTVMVGAFRDKEVQSVLGLDKDKIPLALMPIGRKHP